VAPLMDGAAAVGTTTKYAREDHRHPTDTTKADLTQVVRYDTAQALTAAQQVQARANVYAAPFDAMAYNGMQINGSMEVNQFNPTAINIPAGSSADVLDGGWKIVQSGVQVVSAQQNSTVPSGYRNSLQVYVTTANTAPAVGDYTTLQTNVEGYRLIRLGWGGANAQSVTIAFWVYANRPGTYSGSVTNGASDRSYAFTFTIIAAATFEYKVITIPGDTVGTWSKDNTTGMIIRFAMMAGSNRVTTAGAWTAGWFVGVTGTVNGVAATTDAMLITGVVVLPGIEAPSAARSPLIMRPYDQELVTCQRHYFKTGASVGRWYSTTGMQISISHSPMRSLPTPRMVNGTGAASIPGTATYDVSAIAIALQSTQGGQYNLTTATAVSGSTGLVAPDCFALDARL
jgi:hypothetical protein